MEGGDRTPEEHAKVMNANAAGTILNDPQKQHSRLSYKKNKTTLK